MRSVSGASGRVLYGNTAFAPFQLSQIIGTGQSLEAGQGAVASSTVQPFFNVKLDDSRGTSSGYVLTDPQALTLSLVALTALMRPVPPFGDYPQNILGEGPVIEMANCLTALALKAGYATFPVLATCTGLAGAPMSQIQSPQVPFRAGIYETRCAADGPTNGHLARELGYQSFGLLFSELKHGETDSVNFAAANITSPIAYGVPLSQLQGDYETQARANGSEQVPWIPHVAMVMGIQDTAPGSLTGLPIVTQAMLSAAQSSPDQFVAACPNYQLMGFQLDEFHYSEYRPIGDKEAQYGFKYLEEHRLANEQGRATDPDAWAPLWLESADRLGAVATLHLHVPSPPLVLDTTTVTAPHTSGMWSMWAAGHGCVAWDGEVGITAVSGNGVSPIAVTTAGVHGKTTGDTAAQIGVLGNTAANGVFTVTVTGPNTFTLDGTTGNGDFTVGGITFAPIAITSIALAGSDVTVNLARAPVSDLTVGYAVFPDGAYHSGGSMPPRRGNIRDSDPFTPPPPLVTLSPTAIYANWLIGCIATIAVP